MFIRRLYENEKMESLEVYNEGFEHDVQNLHYKNKHFRFCSAIMQGFYHLKDYSKMPSTLDIEVALKNTRLKALNIEVTTDETCNVLGLNLFINAFNPDFSKLLYLKQRENALLWLEYWLLRSAISFWLHPHKKGRKTLLPKEIYIGNVFLNETSSINIFHNGNVPEDLVFNIMQNRFEQSEISIDVNQKTSNYIFQSKSMFALAWAEIWTFIQWNMYATFCKNCDSIIKLNKQKNNTLCKECPSEHYDKRISQYEEIFRRTIGLAPSDSMNSIKNFRYRTKLISEIKNERLTIKDVAQRLKSRYGPIDKKGNDIDWIKQVGNLERKSKKRKAKM
jgi:hypothetical protein